MPLYTIVRQHLLTIYFSQASNPSIPEILRDITENHPTIYLFDSLENVRSAAKIFYSTERPPKTRGSYGLIAEVEISLTDMPEKKTIDSSTLYNDWASSQGVNYSLKKPTEETFDCYQVNLSQIQDIKRTIVPQEAIERNSALHDMDFKASRKATCIIS